MKLEEVLVSVKEFINRKMKGHMFEEIMTLERKQRSYKVSFKTSTTTLVRKNFSKDLEPSKTVQQFQLEVFDDGQKTIKSFGGLTSELNMDKFNGVLVEDLVDTIRRMLGIKTVVINPEVSCDKNIMFLALNKEGSIVKEITGILTSNLDIEITTDLISA